MKSRRLEWRPEYSIGHSDIDQQHQHIFELCGALCMCADEQTSVSDERFRALIDEVGRYMKTHFHCEQFYMEANGYPDFVEHCRQHQEFQGQLEAQFASIENRRNGCAEFADFMADWITDHILTTDMKLKSIHPAQGSR